MRQSESEKKHIAVEKVFISSRKREISTYSAHFLFISWLIIMLLWHSGVACIQAATQMINRLQILLYGV